MVEHQFFDNNLREETTEIVSHPFHNSTITDTYNLITMNERFDYDSYNLGYYMGSLVSPKRRELSSKEKNKRKIKRKLARSSKRKNR